MFEMCMCCLPQLHWHPVILCKLSNVPFLSRCSLLLFPTPQTGKDAAVCASLHQLVFLWVCRGGLVPTGSIYLQVQK